jgi:hypothetical protein
MAHSLSQDLERERVVGIFLGQLHESPSELVRRLDGFLSLLVGFRVTEIWADLSRFLERFLVFPRERVRVGAEIAES